MLQRENRINEIYNSHLEKFIPQYAIFSFICCFALNCVIYWFTQFLMADSYHYNLTTDIDRAIPFEPAWVLVYVLSFVFWLVNYSLVASRGSKEQWYRFATADMMSRIICGIIFIVFPTTNVRPEIVSDGFWDFAMGLIYALDEPYDLFPSIHCLASWLCFIGIRKNKNISFAYKVFSMVFALMICASTQFTKQHYIADMIGGLVIAEACYFISQRTNCYKFIMGLFDRLNDRIFGKYLNEEK